MIIMIDENRNRKNRIKIALIILLMSISLGAISYSFGFVTTNPRGVTSNYFMISEIDFGLSNDVNSVSLGEVLPTLDKFGILNDAFTFTVTNTSDSDKDYVVKLIDGSVISTISNKEIRYQLTIDEKIVGIYNLTDSGIIDSGNLNKDESHTYSIKIWLDYDSNVTNGVWDKIVLVDAGDDNLDTSGANKPSLSDGMIPVYYDTEKEVWRKADLNNADKNHQWYDYDSLMWANVVTVNNDSRDDYIKANIGSEIRIGDINSFWVWIPRYKYTIFSASKPGKINISFENGIKSTGSVSCVSEFDEVSNTSEKCVDNKNGSIKNDISTYTHPAFTFGDLELEGIWVSKFEAGYIENDKNIYIKPNVESVGDIEIMTLSKKFREMGLKNNIYGFIGGDVLNSDLTIDEDKNKVDVHMIKNSEWGAVTYLYHSKYGKYGNNDYSNVNKEIYHNDSNKTGYSMGSSNSKTGSYQYNVNGLGTGASTTGNIYGIYDMNGGKGEMVMTNSLENIDNVINNKYYDSYLLTDNLKVTKLGDALKETKWYDDSQYIGSNKVLYRGGIITSYKDGVFGINTMSSEKMTNVGSRPVLISESNVYITNW